MPQRRHSGRLASDADTSRGEAAGCPRLRTYLQFCLRCDATFSLLFSSVPAINIHESTHFGGGTDPSWRTLFTCKPIHLRLSIPASVSLVLSRECRSWKTGSRSEVNSNCRYRFLNFQTTTSCYNLRRETSCLDRPKQCR